MLGWIGGQNDQTADESKIMEPPETPAPIFALRAFQSALFGTPKAGDEDITNSNLNPNQQMSDNTSTQKPAEQKENSATITKPEPDPTTTATSPTKSILMTPGTASNRRKTVSFGEGVVDNERKRDDASNRWAKTPVMASGNISSQWTSSSSEGKRSRLTQALMDSREKPSRASEKPAQKPSQPSFSEAGSKPAHTPPQGADDEDTINMNEPRSRSGQYWKTEFDSYRAKTALEIKRLIQYRSAAKQYAKMKDDEAYRLAMKLKEEELKVEEMERQVMQLASTMVAEDTGADDRQLVRDLTKQTTLALEWRHKANLLREALEKHGIVGNEVDKVAGQSDADIPAKAVSEALAKTQQALDQANAKIEEMKQQQPDFENLRGLALSSEQKASELEKENAMLKHTLARVKQETSKYEDRRKEREAKLKQREAKLETRIREYRERLKTTTQHHREQEEAMKASFDDERRSLRVQNDALGTRVRALEYATRQRLSGDSKQQIGKFVYGSGHVSPQKEPFDETGETDLPPSPSPRGARLGIIGELADEDARRAMSIKDIDERIYNLPISPLKGYKGPYRDLTDLLLPSSPPVNPSIETNVLPSADNRRTHATASLPSRRLHLESGSVNLRPDRLYRARPSATKYSLAALSSDFQQHHRAAKRHTLPATQRDPVPMERKPAAHKRHERKGEALQEGKEGTESLTVRTALKT
ncbi:spindle pole body formation-associated protein-domain-containing protein [Aspergillus carlsbadensis]|nr:spindle pole body formation-associated protein-domain-containing protein [Aspergillus carlsbadensis]